MAELIGFAGTNEGQQSISKPKKIFANGTCRGSLSFLTFLSLVLFRFFFSGGEGCGFIHGKLETSIGPLSRNVVLWDSEEGVVL